MSLVWVDGLLGCWVTVGGSGKFGGADGGGGIATPAIGGRSATS